MKTRSLSLPKLMFIVTTRAALAAGVTLLVSRRMKESTKKKAGIALAALGGLTTIPAAMIAAGKLG